MLAEAGVLVVDNAAARLRPGQGRHRDPDPRRGRSTTATTRVAVGRVVDRRGARRRDGAGPRAAWPPSSRASPTTAPSSSAASRTCCCTARACRARATQLAGRPVVVVVRRPRLGGRAARASSPSSASSDPVLIGVDRGADALLGAGLQPDVVVVDADRATTCPRPRHAAKARDVVVLVDRGDRATGRPSRSSGIGVRPLRFETGATTEDAALMLASPHEAIADRRGRDARHARRVPRPAAHRPRQHLPHPAQGRPAAGGRRARSRCSTTGGSAPGTCWPSLLAGLVALAAAIGVTPVGQEWLDAAPRRPRRPTCIDTVQGLFS